MCVENGELNDRENSVESHLEQDFPKRMYTLLENIHVYHRFWQDAPFLFELWIVCMMKDWIRCFLRVFSYPKATRFVTF
jgi:hypothetical protein